MSISKTVQFLEERLESNPKSLLFAILADIYLQEGRLEDAVQLCAQGVKHNPEYITGKYILAKAYFMQGENEKAETELKHILTHDRQYLSAHKLMADIMMRMGWENSAVMHYKEILRYDPQCDEVREAMNALAVPEETPSSEPPPAATKPKTEAPKTYIAATPKRQVQDVEDDVWLSQLDEAFPAENEEDIDLEEISLDDLEEPIEESVSEETVAPATEEIPEEPEIIEEDVSESSAFESEIILDSELKQDLFVTKDPELSTSEEDSFLSKTLEELDDFPIEGIETEPVEPTPPKTTLPPVSFNVPQGLSAEELERALDEILDTSGISEEELKQAIPDASLDKTGEPEAPTEEETDLAEFDLDELDEALKAFDSESTDTDAPTEQLHQGINLEDLDIPLENDQIPDDTSANDSFDENPLGITDISGKKEEPLSLDHLENLFNDETSLESDPLKTETDDIDNVNVVSEASDEATGNVSENADQLPEIEDAFDDLDLDDLAPESTDDENEDADLWQEKTHTELTEPPSENTSREPEPEVDVDLILENILSNQELLDDDDDYDSEPSPSAKDKRDPKSKQTSQVPETSPEALESNPLFEETPQTVTTHSPEPELTESSNEELLSIPDVFLDEPAGHDTKSSEDTDEMVPPATEAPVKESKLVSPTLGEIYAAQGEYTKAIKVYQTLLEKHPDEQGYQDKIKELRKKLEEKSDL